MVVHHIDADPFDTVEIRWTLTDGLETRVYVERCTCPSKAERDVHASSIERVNEQLLREDREARTDGH